MKNILPYDYQNLMTTKQRSVQQPMSGLGGIEDISYSYVLIECLIEPRVT